MSTGPMRPIELQLLLALLDGELHGYALTQAVQQESGGAIELEPGNLYRRLHQLLGDGLLRETECSSGGERRRCYAITARGRRAVAAELRRLEAQIALGRRRGLGDVIG